MRSLLAALLVTGCAHAPVRAPSIDAPIAAAPAATSEPTIAAAPMWPHTTFWEKLIAIEPPVHADDSISRELLGPMTTPSAADRWLITDEGHLQRTNDLSKDVAARHRRMRGDRGTQVDRVDQRVEAQRPSGPDDGRPARGDGRFQSHRTFVEIPWTCVLRQQ